jgi:hypothetical protein
VRDGVCRDHQRPDRVANVSGRIAGAACQGRAHPVSVRPVKFLGICLFFGLWTLLGAIGMVMAVHGKGSWLLVVTLLGYLGLFAKEGCLGGSH